MGIFSKTTGDSNGAESKPLGGNEAAAISSASAEIKSKRGGYRPGSGRKPNGVNQGVAQPSPGKAGENQIVPSEADIEFARKIAESGLKILDRIETNVICGIIAGIGDKTISERTDGFLRQREIGEGDIELVVNAVGAIAAKYAILSRYAPEMALVSWAAIHGMAFQGVMGDLKKLAITVKGIKAKGIKTDDASPPQAN